MSTLKVNKIRDTAGAADSITLDPNGGAVIAGVTTVSTVKVGSGVTITSDGDIFHAGVCTATSFSGQIPAASIVGVCTSGLTKTGGFGKVLQVVTSGIDNGEHMIATSSTSYVTDANLPQATITPISSSSDILIIAHIGMQHDGTDQIENTIYREVSGASAVDLSASNTYGLAFNGVNGAQIYNGCYINVTDTGRPSGTTQTTYKWYGRSEFGGDVKLRHKSSVCMTLVEFEP